MAEKQACGQVHAVEEACHICERIYECHIADKQKRTTAGGE